MQRRASRHTLRLRGSRAVTDRISPRRMGDVNVSYDWGLCRRHAEFILTLPSSKTHPRRLQAVLDMTTYADTASTWSPCCRCHVCVLFPVKLWNLYGYRDGCDDVMIKVWRVRSSAIDVYPVCHCLSMLQSQLCSGPPSNLAFANTVDNVYLCELHYYCCLTTPTPNITAYICYFRSNFPYVYVINKFFLN